MSDARGEGRSGRSVQKTSGVASASEARTAAGSAVMRPSCRVRGCRSCACSAPTSPPLPLDHEPLPAEEVVDGSPTAAVLTLDTVGGAEVGLWEMTEGTARDTEVDEVFVVRLRAGAT